MALIICKKCGRSDEHYPESFFDLHHIIPKYLGGTDKDGRVWLCKNCHKQIHLRLYNCINKITATKPEIKEFTKRWLDDK